MIAGIGVDLCGIQRMACMLQDEKIMQRMFTEHERAYFAMRNVMGSASAAACYAAKEAFAKALGTGIGAVGFLDIEILHDALGKPIYQVHGKAQSILMERGITACHLSISHEGDMAVAFAVLEKGNQT